MIHIFAQTPMYPEECTQETLIHYQLECTQMHENLNCVTHVRESRKTVGKTVGKRTFIKSCYSSNLHIRITHMISYIRGSEMLIPELCQ